MLRASPTGTGGQCAQLEMEGQCSETHVVRVQEVLTRMQRIKPGMTRRTLLSIFTTEGGLSNGLRRTYVRPAEIVLTLRLMSNFGRLVGVIRTRVGV
jgi:hypothetical protein